MSWLPIAFGILGGITTAASNIMKGDAEKEAADFNALQAEQDAGLTEQKYQEDERVFRVNTRQELGGIRAAYGASGVSSSEGSAADVLASSAANAELDALKLRHEGVVKAIALRDAAKQMRRTGQAAQTSGYVSAVGSLFSTAGTLIGRSSAGSTYAKN